MADIFEMKKYLLASVLFISSQCFGKDWSLAEKIVFGGNLGLQFGNPTLIDVSPQIGYRVTERFVPGIGVKYSYYKFKDDFFNESYDTDVYGGSIWSKYYFTENLLGYAEYEIINLEVYEFNALRRINIESVFVGGGYHQPISESFGVQLLVLFNLNESQYKIYDNPIIRVGFGFGF